MNRPSIPWRRHTGVRTDVEQRAMLATLTGRAATTPEEPS